MLESGDMQPSQDVIMSTYRFGKFIFQAQDHKIAAALSARKSLLTDEAEPSSNIGRDKSFVDDLNKELGIVRMRVAFVPRSAEIQPTFWRFVITFTHHLLLIKI
jgi:hypothetical protein